MDVTIDGNRAHAATGSREGSADDPVVVLIHGAGMDRSVWQFQTRNIAHQGRRALAVDLPGHGYSDGPALTTIAEMADLLAMDASMVNLGVMALEREGLVLRGQFRQGIAGEEFCDRRILARIHRSTIGRLRKEIEPVPVASLIRFLLEWQHTTPGSRLAGEMGMVEVIEQLQGFEAAAAGWESALLPHRLTDFKPSTLDTLCFGGEVAWGRFARRCVWREKGDNG